MIGGVDASEARVITMTASSCNAGASNSVDRNRVMDLSMLLSCGGDRLERRTVRGVMVESLSAIAAFLVVGEVEPVGPAIKPVMADEPVSAEMLKSVLVCLAAASAWDYTAAEVIGDVAEEPAEEAVHKLQG